MKSSDHGVSGSAAVPDASLKLPLHGLRVIPGGQRARRKASGDEDDWRSTLSDDWDIEAVPVPARFTNDPAARAAITLVVSGDRIVYANVLNRPPAEQAELARILAKELDAAIANAGRTPRRIHVRHVSVARALRSRMRRRGIGIHTERELPDTVEAAKALLFYISGVEDVPLVSFPETWAAWGFSREDVGKLFRVAAAYYRAQPWDVFADNEPVAATLADGVELHAVIMGTAGKECGLALYADADDLLLLHFLQHTERAMFGARGAVLSLSFSPAREVPPHMRREIRDTKWEIAGPAAYPMLTALNTPGGGVQSKQFEAFVAVLGSLPRFVATLRRNSAAGAKKAKRWKDRVTGITLAFTPPSRLGWADLLLRHPR